MTATVHVYEIYIRAPQQRVWDALITADDTVRYFHGTRFESSFEPGAPFVNRIVADGRPAADGVIEAFEPPHRFAYTWHVLYDDAMAAEPPGRVEWLLTPANADGSVTRVTVRHTDLGLSPITWEHVRLGWVEITAGLKTWIETGEALPDVDAAADPAADPADLAGGWHRSQAIVANNATWELLDGREHSADEADDLLQRAYAAAYHWRRASGATAVHHARGSWLVSRAHATLGHGTVALHHADRCAEHTAAAGSDAADFDRAYAHEARARALAAIGRFDESSVAYRAAAEIEIEDDQDRSIFEADLGSEPWFGLERT